MSGWTERDDKMLTVFIGILGALLTVIMIIAIAGLTVAVISDIKDLDNGGQQCLD